MKYLRVIYQILGIFSGVLFLTAMFLHPLTAHSQIDSETAVSTPTPAIVNSEKLDDALLAQIETAEPDELVRYIVHLPEQVDSQRLTRQIEDEEVRRAVLVTQLQETAEQSQQALVNNIQSLQQAGSVQTYRSLWIINAVAVEGTVAGIAKLAARPDVARIALDEARPLIAPPTPAEKLDIMWRTAALTAAGDEPWGIERVRASYAWQALGIDGAGVTVGIMDSGVDWLHPDLLPNYRGNMGGGAYDHIGNWYDTTVPTMTVPHDVLGHGTHVAGTAVGQNGIGVAPGANWIAVNIATPSGLIYNSDAHAGFQWLLAPAGSPALAPDVINGSWSGPGTSTEFVPDIQALDAAGIITVFAAGNSGPDEETIGSPASFIDTLAVGATDETGGVAWFSSRGPSPLHKAYHPHIVAPGASIYSSLPNGTYGYYNGTSMAAPHTTGAVALLLAADKSLSRQNVTRILTETAVPIATMHPNMNSGWGELDVYHAAAQAASPGILTGMVHENEQPLPGVIVTVTNGSDVELPFITDENGRYTAYLKPGTYQLTTTPFTYQPITISNLVLTAENTTTRDVNLDPLPTGTLIVQIVDDETNLPVEATINILNTPLNLDTTAYGTINVLVPPGSYNLEVWETGYKIGKMTVTVVQDHISARTIRLTPTKKVLLVDTGAWYYRSYGSYFGESLAHLGYAYDTHIVTNPVNPGFPKQAQLNEYDVLVWSAPYDSPGYIGANNVITDFLGQGGNLFISGQDIGYFDGFGFGTQVWWYRDLQASFLGETAVNGPITGSINSSYNGLTFTLNTGDSANNQAGIDVSQPRLQKFSEPIFLADDNLPVGLQAGLCTPFRMSYLGFGLEGVPDADNRDEILAQSFKYFDTPRQKSGMIWYPGEILDFAPPGEELIYPVKMQHLGELITDTYSLHIDNNLWPVSLNTTSIEIGPCQSEIVTVTVKVPGNLPREALHDFKITAVSQKDPAMQMSLPIHHKTPDHILLVDDDRWYNQEEIYRSALTDAGFTFDEWEIGWDNNAKGSPPLSLLKAYNYVIWYTGYDWFAPITNAENQVLTAYIKQGGRLFLSSQDFLYYNYKSPLAQTYLGIREYQESITPTLIYRGHQAVPPNLHEPIPLFYTNFRNNSDGLTPGSNASPFVWHDKGMAGGVANQNPYPATPQNSTLYRTIFYGFPFEKLPSETQAPMMNGIVGWLSDLGDSTFEVDQRIGDANASRFYTITLQNNPLAGSNQTQITNTLPVSLTLLPATLTGNAVYDETSRQIRWQGLLDSSEIHTITYQATPSQPLPENARIDNSIDISYDRHELTFNRIASFWVDAPDLSKSTISSEKLTGTSTQFVTYTVSLENSSDTLADTVTTTIQIPENVSVSGYTMAVKVGELTGTIDSKIVWTGSLLPDEIITATIFTTRTIDIDEPEWLTAVVYLEDGITNPIIISDMTHLAPHKHYFPLIARIE